MEMSEPVTTATLVALCFGLIKIIEKLIEHFVEKFGKKEKEKETTPTVVQLDVAVSKMINETHERVSDMHKVMSKTDGDGSPLVYSSRSALEMIRLISSSIQDISKSQERLAVSLDRLSTRFEDHARTIEPVVGRVSEALEDIESLPKAS